MGGNKMAYKRYFITLQPDSLEYNAGGRTAAGRCVLEGRGDSGKLSLWAQDLNPDVAYKIYMILTTRNKYIGVFMGKFHLDAKLRGEFKTEFSAGNLADGLDLSSCCAVALVVSNKRELICPLVGYKDEPVMWKNHFEVWQEKKTAEKEPEVIAAREAEKPDETLEVLAEADSGKPEETEAPRPQSTVATMAAEVGKAEDAVPEAYEAVVMARGQAVEETPEEASEPQREMPDIMALQAGEPEGMAAESQFLRNGPQRPDSMEPDASDAPVETEEEFITDSELGQETSAGGETPYEPETEHEEDEADLQPDTKGGQPTGECLENEAAEPEDNYVSGSEYGTAGPEREERGEYATEGDFFGTSGQALENNLDSMKRHYKSIVKQMKADTGEPAGQSQAAEPEAEPQSDIERILHNNIEMVPFEHPSPNLRWVRISLKEPAYLDIDYRNFCNHPLVVSAYRKYKHLILGRQKAEGQVRYILGVPGVFEPQYRVMAQRLGFTQFKCVDDVDTLRAGEYGYWLLSVGA
jgi:hypothetical protein